jgi:ATP-dependent Clp protease ATP-binding subunit ClpC
MIFYDLQREAQRKTIGDVVCRDIELLRLGRTVRRQYNNNALIRGVPGIGKSALLEGFCYRLALGKIPGFLANEYTPIKLEASELRRFSASAEGLSQIIGGFKSLPAKTIVIIDDIHLAIGTESDKSSALEQIIQNLLQRPDVSVLAAITENAYQKLLSDSQNFLKLFEQIELKETDIAQTAEITAALGPAFAKEYGIGIGSAAALTAAQLSRKMQSGASQPLRAIHFLDESLAYAKINGHEELSIADIRHVFSEKTGIPDETLSGNDREFLNGLGQTLRAKVIGQDYAVEAVADVIQRSRMGLRNPHRPYGSFLFLGTSGVGKTELAKTLAQVVYGSERSFTRIDMSEFGEAHTVQRLLGAPPGYIGFESGGQLTNAVQERPYSLILLDEIEKANAKIFDIFLQVFDDGRLTDGRGQTAQFTNSILIATSNLGVAEIMQGFENGENLNSPEFISEKLMPVLLRRFNPEFLNRFDAIIVFEPLGTEELLKIAQLEIKKIEQRVAEHDIHFDISPEILRTKIIEVADPRMGARPIKRFVEQTCERLIAMKLLEEK